MKSIFALPRVRFLVVAALAVLPGALEPVSAGDPALQLSVERVGGDLVLTWFGEAGVAYQLETGSSLATWVDFGLVRFGAGEPISVTHAIAGQTRGFFRVKCLPASSVTAVFDAGTGVLTITGSSAADVLVVSRDVNGLLRINNGAVTITGGVPTVANTTLIEIFGRDGHDQLVLDETNGALPRADLFGEGGDDQLTGGSGDDELRGGPGDDTLVGKGGMDRLFGGDDNDTLTGGDGDDQAFGESGNDRMIWNPGDDTDLNEGDDGTDTVEVNGGGGAEVFTVTANGLRVRFDRLDPAPFSLDIGTCEDLVLAANGGNDSFSATGNLAALIQITADGGAGNDTLLGSNGADVLLGGDGDDFLDGQQGNDVAFLGDGDDVFQWDPGDGSDTIEGQGGSDTLRFNGSNAAEIMEASANGARVRFTRDIGNIVMDLGGMEAIDLSALGGADTITVHDLAGTELADIKVSLAGVLGGTTGDAQADTIVVNGTAGDDIFTVGLAGDELVIEGAGVRVAVVHFEPGSDTVRLLGLGGEDVIDAMAVGVGGPRLTLDGGAGNDILIGGAGVDILLGGNQDDLLLGNGGPDLVDGGGGENTLFSGVFRLTTGIVTLVGDDLDNTIVLSRDAGGALFSNGVAIPGATVGNTALIRVFGRGGDDTIMCDETNGALPAVRLFGGAGRDTLTGSASGDYFFGGTGNDSAQGRGGVDILFGGADDDTMTGGDGDDRAFGEGGDDRMIWNPGDDSDLNEGGGGTDTVEVNGGGGAEVFTVTANGLRVRFDRLDPAPFFLDIGTCEQFVLEANGGNDSFSATGNLAALIQITADGGPGNDTLLGSNGADVLLGGDGDDFLDGQQGNDVAFLGDGDDVFQWDPGDGSDTVEGQDGSDTLRFNGSNAAEIMEASANGARVRFTRNIGNIVMDLGGIEGIDVNALGATDTVIVHDLAGTELADVSVSLAGTLGGTTGDAQADTVIVNGTAGADVLTATFAGGECVVGGLTASVRVAHFEPGLDTVRLQGLGGEDVLDALAVGVGGPLLVLDGGSDDDTLRGGAGNDHLTGGPGNDTLTGGDGDDQVFGDGDNDRFIWNPGDDSDLNEGGEGIDTVEVNGAGGAEVFTVTANGTRVRFDRLDPAPFFLDIGTCEQFVLEANGGNDSFSATGNLAALIQITADGGPGNDTLLGSNGADVLLGGDGDDFLDGQQGNDVAFLGDGDDVFQWDPGDGSDTVEGQDGSDTLRFNGSNAAEIMEASANGARVRFTRNIGNIVMDLGGVETIDLNTLGAADAVIVNDLTGTALGALNVSLAGTLGGGSGDTQPDTVTVNGTPSPDSIFVLANPGAVQVAGLSALVRISDPEPAIDRLVLNGLGGVDTFDIGANVSGLIQVITNQ